MSRCLVIYRQNTCIFHENYSIKKYYCLKYIYIYIYMIFIKVAKRVLMSTRLTRGGRKNNGPAFSAGQWPSLACRAEKKCALLLTAVVAVPFVISSPSSTFTCAIVCLKFFFSLKNCKLFLFYYYYYYYYLPNEMGVCEEQV